MLNSIANSFKAIFPSEHANLCEWKDSVVSIEEKEKNATFTEFKWTGNRFLWLNPVIAKEMSSFFTKRKSQEILLKDCDGVMMFEEKDQPFLFLSELKSSFSTGEIAKAKTQILSSYLKFNMLLTLMQNWKNENVTAKGFIISPAPKASFRSELKRDAGKAKNSKDRYKHYEKIWSWTLISSGKNGVKITPYESFHLDPCKFGERGVFKEITFYFIEVPDGASSHQRSVTDFI